MCTIKPFAMRRIFFKSNSAIFYIKSVFTYFPGNCCYNFTMIMIVRFLTSATYKTISCNRFYYQCFTNCAVRGLPVPFHVPIIQFIFCALETQKHTSKKSSSHSFFNRLINSRVYKYHYKPHYTITILFFYSKADSMFRFTFKCMICSCNIYTQIK